MNETITISRFEKVDRERNNSLVGFVTFTFNGQFAFNRVQVHELRSKSGYRLVYAKEKREDGDPIVCPISSQVQKLIDKEVSSYIKGQGILG